MEQFPPACLQLTSTGLGMYKIILKKVKDLTTNSNNTDLDDVDLHLATVC